MTSVTAAPISITVVVNGTQVTKSIEPRRLLVEFLRDDLGLTGTKMSCGMQVCGVCSVLIDSRPVSSCTYLAVDADGCNIETVEGLAGEGGLHPLQEQFAKKFALQCGFCTPGFLMMSKALLDSESYIDREDIIRHLEGNICRCTGYAPIIEAVETVAENREKGD